MFLSFLQYTNKISRLQDGHVNELYDSTKKGIHKAVKEVKQFKAVKGEKLGQKRNGIFLPRTDKEYSFLVE